MGNFISKKISANFHLIKIDRAQVGVTSLVEEGAFSAAFPLHDVSKSCQYWKFKVLVCL